MTFCGSVPNGDVSIHPFTFLDGFAVTVLAFYRVHPDGEVVKTQLIY
jgi:hypothetical protein